MTKIFLIRESQAYSSYSGHQIVVIGVCHSLDKAKEVVEGLKQHLIQAQQEFQKFESLLDEKLVNPSLSRSQRQSLLYAQESELEDKAEEITKKYQINDNCFVRYTSDETSANHYYVIEEIKVIE